MAGKGKRLRGAYESFDRLAEHSVSDAVKLVLENKKTKFDETVEVAAGDSVHIPARVPHSYHVEGDERFEFLCVVPNGLDQITVVES